MSEAQEQEVIIQWADLNGLPLFHIPNGGFWSSVGLTGNQTTPS